MARTTTGELVAGRYRMVRRLGHGGMGTVHLAHDERLDRPVALKRLHAGASGEFVRRFEREARLGAALDHPNLVAVYDVVHDDDAVAIAMEYVDGESVAQALERRTVPAEEAVAIVRHVAAALDHAHARGVVHRDVKPSNVLLGPHGAKLADLGISTAADSTRITTSGSVLGTAAYMAPEQLTGGTIGYEADIHGLGLLAYELLAGVPARSGGTPLQLAHRVTTEPPPDIRAVRPDIPPDAALALQRALALDPLDRQPRASRLALDLERALLRPAPEVPGFPPAQDSRDPRRPPPRRWPARVLAMTALLLVAGIAIALLGSGGDGDDDAPADREAATPTTAVESAGPETTLTPATSDAASPAATTADGPDTAAPEPRSDAAPETTAAPGTDAAPATTDAAPATDAAPETETTSGSSPPPEEPAEPPAATTAPVVVAGRTPGPAEVVRAFYERGAAGDHAGAWALLDAGGQRVFGSEQRLAATLATLESVSFSRLEETRSGNTATVAFADAASHGGTDPHVDHCEGTIDLALVAGAWRISRFGVRCQRA